MKMTTEEVEGSKIEEVASTDLPINNATTINALVMDQQTLDALEERATNRPIIINDPVSKVECIQFYLESVLLRLWGK